MKEAARRVWVQVRRLRYNPETNAAYHSWENTIAAPIEAARGHEARLSAIVGSENVRICQSEKQA